MLSGQKDRAVTGQGLFQSSDRAGTTDFECDLSEGEYNNVANWHHWVPGNVSGGFV